MNKAGSKIFATLLTSLFLVAMGLVLNSCSGSGGSEGQSVSRAELPPHTVYDNTSLAPKDGRRIEIRVDDPNLSKGDCERLIANYKPQAGPEGQVSVRKPDKRGDHQPWGVDNMDGKGVTYHDYNFQI